MHSCTHQEALPHTHLPCHLLLLPVQDWAAILVARARELKAGGHLVVANFGVSPQAHWLGHTDIGWVGHTFALPLWADAASDHESGQPCPCPTLTLPLAYPGPVPRLCPDQSLKSPNL